MGVAIHYPLSKKRVARFMWSIEQTIRPNGQVLQGHPAEVDQFIPLTCENYATYHNPCCIVLLAFSFSRFFHPHLIRHAADFCSNLVTLLPQTSAPLAEDLVSRIMASDKVEERKLLVRYNKG